MGEIALFDAFMPIINQVGFPIFVTAYLLFMKNKNDQQTLKILEEIKCLQEQILETKLQVGQAMKKQPDAPIHDGRNPTE